MKPFSRLNVEVPAPLHKDLRRMAVENDTTVTAIVVESVKERVERFMARQSGVRADA